jgi:hypothetical protein
MDYWVAAKDNKEVRTPPEMQIISAARGSIFYRYTQDRTS